MLVLLLLFLFYEANAVGALGGRTRSTAHGRPLYASVYRSASGIEIHFEAQAPEVDPPGLTRVWDVTLFQDIASRKRGAWWPTREVTELKLFPGSLTAAEQAAMLPAIAAAFDRQPDFEQVFPRSAALARAGVWRTSMPLLSGIIRNSVDGLLALWLLIGGFFAVRESLWRAKRAARSTRGQCPTCGFDLAGLNGKPCPECGHQRVP